MGTQLSGDLMFGAISDSSKNGVPAGGGRDWLYPIAPATAQHASDAVAIDPGGAIHPRTSPVFWLVAIAAGVLLANYYARR